MNLTGMDQGVGRKEPVRMCLGCRERSPQHELIRFSRSEESRSEGRGWCVKQRGVGRGAYVRRNVRCIFQAMVVKRLSRALRVSVHEGEVAQLQQLLREEIERSENDLEVDKTGSS